MFGGRDFQGSLGRLGRGVAADHGFAVDDGASAGHDLHDDALIDDVAILRAGAGVGEHRIEDGAGGERDESVGPGGLLLEGRDGRRRDVDRGARLVECDVVLEEGPAAGVRADEGEAGLGARAVAHDVADESSVPRKPPFALMQCST